MKKHPLTVVVVDRLEVGKPVLRGLGLLRVALAHGVGRHLAVGDRATLLPRPRQHLRVAPPLRVEPRRVKLPLAPVDIADGFWYTPDRNVRGDVFWRFD